MSSPSAMRPAGMRASTAFSSSRPVFKSSSTPSVATWPGATALTRSPFPAHSTAIDRVKLSSAAFDAE